MLSMNKRNIFVFFVLFYSSNSVASTLDLEWQHYTSPPSLKTQLRDYVLLNWDQRMDFHKGPFYFSSHVQAEYSLDQSKIFYFNIPELYLFYRYDLQKPLYHIQSIELSVGRKVKVWSLADEYWDMGLWNPLSRWNPIHPETNGLIGSLLSLLSNQWSFDFFLGALYLPNQEAQLFEKNEEISSRSRWFNPLPNQVDALDIDIDYLKHNPFIFDILFQQSYLLSFKTWSETPTTYYWMKWSIADKPVNHLFFVLNKTNLFKIGKEEGVEGSVNQNITILPVRQRLLSAEWGFDYNNLSTVFTVENTKMREVKAKPEGWDFFNHRESFSYFSTILKYSFSDQSFVQVAYIQTWFKNYNINNVVFDNKHPSILRRHKVLAGIGLDWQKEVVSFKGLKRVFSLSYRYSFLNEGSWLFLETLYYITPEIYAGLTFDILGSKSAKNYFFNQFRHNDYFSWSLTYDF